MTISIKNLGLGFLAVGALSACGKGSEFWYRQSESHSNRTITFDHQVTALVGWSSADILWVIDNSNSMDDDQAAVAANTDRFMNQFIQNQSLKWRMGLISTDEHDAPYVGFATGDILDAGRANPVSVFQQAVRRLGVNGDVEEKSFDPMDKAFIQYPGFLRKDALLAVIMLTDEDEQSRRFTPQSFYNYLLALKGGNPAQIATYMVTETESPGCSANETIDPSLSNYRSFVQIAKGKVFSLRCPTFGDSLAKLGQDIMQRTTQPRLPLNERPIPSTIKIHFNGKNIPGGPKESGGFWIYDYLSNALVFHDLSFVDVDNASVQVEFKADDGWQN